VAQRRVWVVTLPLTIGRALACSAVWLVRAPWPPSSSTRLLRSRSPHVTARPLFGPLPATVSSALAASSVVGLRLAAAGHRHKPRYSAFDSLTPL
jgi:hypothetical protein